MMNDPLRRKMFREAGMSKQPMGILASSPELMNATQSPGYSHGGLHKANWMNNDNIYSPNLTTYKNKALSVGKDVIGTETPPTKSELEQLAEMKRQETIKDLQLVPEGSASNFGVDTSGEQMGPILAGEAINKTSETILNDEKYRLNKSLSNREVTNNEIISSNKPRNDGGTSDSTSISSSFKNQLTKVNEEKKAAVTAMATGMSDANQYLMGGKTYTQHLGEYTSLLNTKGVEPTLADIKNDAMNLLQFDPATLDKEYDEDKQASMWLNMMKAGLAIASGESPNALTNIAKGFAYGLDSYGKDLGSLKKDLRADKKDATNTMYKLLNDKKSEVLAKRMLNIKEKEGLLNIQKNYIDSEKATVKEAFSMKMTNAKWNVDLISTFAQMEMQERGYNLSAENAEKTYQLALGKATPDIINMLKLNGDVTLKPNMDKEIPWGQEGFEKQWVMTPVGRKSLQNFISNLSLKTIPGSNTDTAKFARTYAKTGKVGALYFDNFDKMEQSDKEDFGLMAYNLSKSLIQMDDDTERLDAKLSFATTNGMKVKFSNLTKTEQEMITAEPRKGQTSYRSMYQSILDFSK